MILLAFWLGPRQNRTDPQCTLFVLAVDDAGMSKKIRSSSDKIAIVMESFTANIGAAELCRKHSLSPARILFVEREIFGGRKAGALNTQGQ